MMVFSTIMQRTDQKGKKNIWEFMSEREIVHWIRPAPYRVLTYKLILHERKLAESG